MPSLSFLRASEELWKRRHEHRQERLTVARKLNDKDRTKKWESLRDEASKQLALRREQISDFEWSPTIVTSADLGLSYQNLFGSLGKELYVTGHYSAGPRARNINEGKDRARSFHAYHASQGWGGCGYHYIICDTGEIICMRPVRWKGAHTGGKNSNNVGINMPGTVGDLPTPEQVRSYKWLLSNAHTTKLPQLHRTTRSLRNCQRYGHNSWSGHYSNGCPGLFKPAYLAG